MSLGLSFVHSFSVLTPILDAHAGTLGHLPHLFVSKQPFQSKWVTFEKWGSFGMGSFPRLPNSGIAGNSAVGITFVPFNRRENRRSLAIFFAEEIAHVGALKIGDSAGER